MRFTLNPTVRQLAVAFPVLLIALPVAMSAGDDRPGPALPPPSLYETPQPGQPAEPAPAPSVSKPSLPSQSAPPPAAKAPEPVKPAAAPVAAKPAPAPMAPKPAPVAKTASEPSEPWYRRWFSWLPWNSPRQSAAAPAKAEREVKLAAMDTGGRGEYAYDTPSRTIRTGMMGDCVRTGLWSPTAATADCDPSMVAKKPMPAKTVVAVSQPPRPVPAGSAPAPTSIRQARPEPVEVVPLPPAPPAAEKERPLEPEVKEETITALAEARFMPEPDFDKLTLSAGALFPLSSSNIKPSGHEKLDEFVEHLRGMQFDTVRIVGYTDPTGPKAMNESLSKRRAEAVKGYLVSKGVDPKRIQTAGKGGSEPLPKTTDCDALPRMDKIICYAPDRRVEIEVIGNQPHG
jgi:OOP family OmpA-OmpF porin